MISSEEFSNLSTAEAAKLVRAAGPKVCVFPINNTRRWFAMEHGYEQFTDPLAAYMTLSGHAHIRIYKLIFDHGLDTLINPVFGGELFRRGDAYVQKIGADGLERLANHPDFLNFYAEYGVRVRFYGNYRAELSGTPYEYLIERFETAAETTRHHDKRRLFFGVFGTDATDFVASFSVAHHTRTGQVPDRAAIVSAYYGEYVAPADLFISSDKFWVFDYPLLSSGEEDLYYMVAPSLYLEDKQLKYILYDHLYARQIDHPDFENMSKAGLAKMKKYYAKHRTKTLGLGRLENDVWFPEW